MSRRSCERQRLERWPSGVTLLLWAGELRVRRPLALLTINSPKEALNILTKRLICAVASVAAVAAALALAPAAGASPYVAGCELQGTANFDNNLTGTSAPFSYSFTGGLTNCQSSNGGPASGNVFAGTQGLTHPTGTGSCSSSTTSGESVIQWADGKTTVITYSTTGAAAALVLTGSIAAATTETNPTTNAPLFTTTEPATPVGSSAGGALAFQPPNPEGCAPGGAGVSSAGISGVIGEGSQS